MATPLAMHAMAPPKEIELEAATVRRREDGIIDLVLAKNVEVTVESAKAINAAVREICDEPSPVLADIRAIRSADILTMRYTAGPEVAAMTRRLALLIGSPVGRMLGSVFMGLSKPPFPTRLFTEERAATAWLLEESGEAE